jgi:ferredoxin-type protein NapH
VSDASASGAAPDRAGGEGVLLEARRRGEDLGAPAGRGRSRRWGRLRLASQLAVAALYVALPLANAAGLREVAGNLASLRLGPLDLTEPAAALSALLAGALGTPLAALGTLALGAAPPVLLALLLGPVFCAWVCPFGLASELLDRALAVVLPGRRRWAARAHERVRAPRAAALAGLLAGSALLGAPLAAILQGPRAVTAAAQEGLYLGAVSPFAAGLLGALLLADLLLPRRLFCRALCPAGAVLNLLRTRRTLRVAWEPARCACAGAPACHVACRWGVDPRSARLRDGCTSCLACVEVCPTGALAPAWGGRPEARPAPRARGD